MAPNTTKPVISEKDAMASAQSVLSTIPDIKDTKITLDTIRPNFHWNDHVGYEQADFVRLAYKITVNNGSIIYIDAVTGENLGGATSLSENAKAFSLYDLPLAITIGNAAYAGLKNLGYNSDLYVGFGPDMYTSMKTFLNSSNSYGFYVSCHGTSNYLTDIKSWWLYSSEITGNWHFVFLDACSTAANTTWANAFKINGYSRRAFLGWSTIVSTDNTYLFATFFWPQVGLGSIRDAAVWAASKVPGAGTTPIRFYGDYTYSGRAY